jgi:hypothetical protein
VALKGTLMTNYTSMTTSDIVVDVAGSGSLVLLHALNTLNQQIEITIDGVITFYKFYQGAFPLNLRFESSLYIRVYGGIDGIVVHYDLD